MSNLSYAQLAAACEAGGATAVSLVTELAPAGGPHAAIAPAHIGGVNDAPTFAYETRFIDGESATTVIIDRKQSQLHRVEAAILQSIRDDDPLLRRVPRVRVHYDGGQVRVTDLELPQRIFDNQIRSGTVDGTPVTDHPRYREARDAAPANARALLELSPGSLVFGCWDLTRKGRQSRYRGALVGEIIGVLADQSGDQARAGGAGRSDAAGAAPEDIDEAELRDDLGVVGCRRIIRTQVLSFAALRQLRFDSGPVGDAACRALLAAYALAGLARANEELTLRANCDLVEAAPTAVKLDARHGDFVALQASSIGEADELLDRALVTARREADIDWRGQIFEVVGDPAVYAALRTGRSADQAMPGAAEQAVPRPSSAAGQIGRRFGRPLFADAKEPG